MTGPPVAVVLMVVELQVIGNLILSLILVQASPQVKMNNTESSLGQAIYQLRFLSCLEGAKKALEIKQIKYKLDSKEANTLLTFCQDTSKEN